MMETENIIVLVIGAIALLLMLINFIFSMIVCIKMFKNGQTGMGVACLVMWFLCLGLGGPLSFIFGWIKAGEWKMKGLMLAWTGFGLVSFMTFACMGVATSMLGQKASATFQSVGQTIGM